MQSFCTCCGAALLPGAMECAECHAVLASAAASTDARTWGIRRPALGLMVLVPTAVLIASLALVIPLAIAAVVFLHCVGIAPGCPGVAPCNPRLAASVGAGGVHQASNFTPPLRDARGCRAGVQSRFRPAVHHGRAGSGLGLPDASRNPGRPSSCPVAGWRSARWPWRSGPRSPRKRSSAGSFLRGFSNRWRLAPALVASAAVFAALHLAPALLLPVFVTGLLLGFLYHRTGSLWPCIAVHAAQNLLAVLSAWLGSINASCIPAEKGRPY